MNTKIEIKSVFGCILFSYKSKNNTILKTLENAVGVSADLKYAKLIGINMSGADLSGVNLTGANLRGADFSGADLSGADLSGANLKYANLSGADLSGANLKYANLSGANLSGADLIDAKLSGANLSGADLTGVRHNEYTCFYESQCPSEGSFIAWKKCSQYIVKLKISETAKRSSATTLKCRCSEAEVLNIENFDGSKADINEICSDYDKSFVYKVGEIVKVDNFNEDRWVECSTGIHFFISRNTAINY